MSHIFWVLRFTRTPTSLLLSQKKYIHELLKKTDLLTAKTFSTPIDSKPVLSQTKGGQLMDDPSIYHSIVSALQYVCITRLDIQFTVNTLSRFMHQPLHQH